MYRKEKESESEVAQSCPTLWDPMECSLPGFSVHGIFQARVLEWVAISSSRGSSWPKDRTQVSCIAGTRFTLWAKGEPSYNLGGNVNGETTMENSMEGPWTLNTEVSYDPAIPFLGLGPERITIQNDTCTLTITTAKTQNSPLTENEDCVAHLYTGMLLSHKDVPRNYHPNGVNQGEKDRYPAGAHTGGPINSSQWAGAQNRDRLTDRESRAVIIKGSQKGGIN